MAISEDSNLDAVRGGAASHIVAVSLYRRYEGGNCGSQVSARRPTSTGCKGRRRSNGRELVEDEEYCEERRRHTSPVGCALILTHISVASEAARRRGT